MFILMYDEWGGFFDHVLPPTIPDGRASSDDNDNFGRFANNIGATRSNDPEPDVDFPSSLEIAAVTAKCNDNTRHTEIGPDQQHHESFEPSDLLESVVRERYSLPSFTPGLRNTDIRDLPVVADDRPR